jgi:hypothetical protein
VLLNVVSDITLAIHRDCTVSSQETSWGQVKARYQ